MKTQQNTSLSGQTRLKPYGQPGATGRYYAKDGVATVSVSVCFSDRENSFSIGNCLAHIGDDCINSCSVFHIGDVYKKVEEVMRGEA